MKRWTSAQILCCAEFTYASLALFALTQGPVTRVWSESAQLVGELPDPSVPHVHFSTYIAIQLPAFLLFARRVRSQWVYDRSNQALIAFIAWLGLSVLWSSFARYSMPEFVALATTTVFGLYLASSFSWHRLCLVIATAMALGVGVSWVAIMRLWDGAVNFGENYWVGIYFNRNSLAPVSAVGLLSALTLTVSSWASKHRIQRIHAAMLSVPSIVLFVCATVELWRSESQTSPLALSIALAACVIWLAMRQIGRRTSRQNIMIERSTLLTLIIASVVILVGFQLEVGLGSMEVSTSSFNQRGGLWLLSWDGFTRRPLQGWGWMAAWHTPLFLLSNGEPTWLTWGLHSSHSGYFDLLLGGGIPALVLFAAFVAGHSTRISHSSDVEGVGRLGLLVYILAAATQESFFVGSHFLWALLVASLALEQSPAQSRRITPSM